MATRAGGSTTSESRRARLEAARAAEVRAVRSRQLLLGASILVVVAVVVIALVTTWPSSPNRPTNGPPPVAGAGVALPPWPAPADPESGMQAAGLVSNPMEGAVQHFHAHLDILDDGSAVEVPANLGIDPHRGLIAELHTHDASGVLHVESGSKTLTFTLGQLFTEWGVRLDADDLGGLHATDGQQLRAYVDGHQVAGDPAAIQLANHQEIALVYGTATVAQIPATYDFAAAGL